MPAEASAFCPGHITAFFEIADHRDSLRKGSRGAGLCTTLGVKTKVKARQQSRQEVRVFVHRDPAPDSATALAVRKTLGGAAYQVFVQAEPQLPVSQGFGMSGAGALSAVLALNEALDLGFHREKLVAFAHQADVEAGTGLGDVYPQSLGGLDVRMEPGGPPHGQVKRLPQEMELLLVTTGMPLRKKEILGNPAKAAQITAAGHRAMERFVAGPTKEALFQVGYDFAVETGLAAGRTKDAMDACKMYGMASQSMLGNSVFATGQMGQLETVLAPFGPRFKCRVDNQGARVL